VYRSTTAVTAHRFVWRPQAYLAGAASIVETVNAALPVSWTWADVSGSLTWDNVSATLTWDDVVYDGVT